MYASPEAVLNNQWNAALEANITEQARRAPHVLMRPTLGLDGTMWCALYGQDLMDGVAGFGETPEKAMEAFDEAWRNQRTPAAIRAARTPQEMVHPEVKTGAAVGNEFPNGYEDPVGTGK